MGLPSRKEPTRPLTPFPGKQECLLTWPRPPVRQKFLFSAKRRHSCQIGHQSIRQVPGRGEALARPVTDSLQCQVTRLIQSSELSWRFRRHRVQQAPGSQAAGEGRAAFRPTTASPALAPVLPYSSCPRMHWVLPAPLSFKQLTRPWEAALTALHLWLRPSLCSEQIIIEHLQGGLLLSTGHTLVSF